MAYGLSIGTTFGPVRWRVLYEVRKWTSPAAMNAEMQYTEDALHFFNRYSL